MSKQRKADLALVLVTLFWGVSYYLVDLCLDELQPMNLNAFRFLLAFLVLAPIFWKKLRHINRATLKYSAIIGTLLVGVYAGATFGVANTSISNAGFICALPVVFTPLLDLLFNRNRPDKRLGIALILCTVGLALLTLNEQFRPAKGDLICLVCAAQTVSGNSYITLAPYVLAALVYFCINYPASKAIEAIERRMRRGDKQ